MVLAAECISKTYGGTTALDSTSVQVAPGEIVFIVGPSGCGKSTLLRCIADLEPRDEGVLSLSGIERGIFGAAQWRTIVTYVPQSRTRLAGTPNEMFQYVKTFSSRNTSLPNGVFRNEAVSVEDVAASLGLEAHMMSKPWSELSGGQAQRAGLAIAIALRPAILLLDEPTSACDPASTELVENAVKMCGAGVLWVSHDPTQPQRVGGRIISFA